MIELLPPGLACADRPGRTSLGSVRVGDVSVYRCEVEETGPGASRGWYLDPASENCIGAELVTFDDVGDDAQLVCPE